MTRLMQTLVGGLLALATCAAGAQTAESKAMLQRLKPADFPVRAIEISVGASAGGGMDITARLLARKLEEYTGARFIVVNKPGAGGMVHNAWLATQAPKEGYLMGLVGNSIVGHSYLNSGGKWSYRDVDNLAFVNYEPVVWLASSTGEFRDMSFQQIVAQARKKPNSVKVGVMTGSMFEMLAEQVEAAANVSLIKVPYPGGAPSLTALMGNHIDLSFGFIGEFAGLGDKVKPLAVASDRAAANLPGVPTFNQALGSDDVQWVFWRYVVAPKGVPAERRAWLVAALNEALKDPQLVAELTQRGATMDRAKLDTPETTTAELERIAALEHRFYLRTGRLKP